MENKKPIKPPFEAPEGYFDKFESRLAEKIGNGKSVNMKVVHRSSRVVWAAVATVTLLLAGLWLYTQRGNTDSVKSNMVQVESSDSLLPQTMSLEKEEGKKAVLIENAVVSEMLESNVQTVAKNSLVISTAEDMKIAEVLEEEGLIDLGIEDGLFEEIEI